MAASNNEGDAAGSSVTMSCYELDEDGFGVDSLALLCEVTMTRNSIEECPCDEDYFDFEFPSLV